MCKVLINSQVFAEFYSEYVNDTVYADSAYAGQKLPVNIKQEICERAYKNRPLTEKQKIENRRKSGVRARIEHVFGFIAAHSAAAHFEAKAWNAQLLV